ncbi:MAG: glycosyltransferase family 39 protein [Victivallaceae bacterium]
MDAFLDNLHFGIMVLPAILLMIIGTLGFGSAALRYLFRAEMRKTLATLPLAFAVGINIIALITLGAGSLKILSPAFNWCALAGGTLFFIWADGRFAISAVTNFIRRNRLFSLLFAAGIFFLLGSALCFPYSWDEQSYQLAVPYRWLNTGTVKVFTDNPYSAFPSMPQFVFRFFIEIGGIFMPRLVSLAVYAAAFLALYLLIKRSADKITASLIIFAIFISPVFLGMTRVVYAEPFILLNLIAVFLIPDVLKKKRVWLLAGLLCGGAAAVKLTGGGVALPVLIWLVFRERKASGILPRLCLFALVAAIIAMPFYLRPLLATGNPFYPFMSTIFGQTTADFDVDTFHHAMGDRYFGLKTVSAFITGPILVSMYDLYHHGAQALFDGIAMGWQFLLLWMIVILGCWLGWRRHSCNRAELGGLLMLFAFYIFWFFTSQQTRFLMPSYFIVAWFAAKLLRHFPEMYRNIILGILLFAAVYSIHKPAFNNFKIAWKLVLSPRDNQYFLKWTIRDPGYVEALAFLAENTPPESSVMLLLERRGLYVPRHYLIAAPRFQSKYLTPLPATSEDLWSEILDTGVDYVFTGITVANPDHIPDFDEEIARILSQVNELKVSGRLDLQFESNLFMVFKVIK